MTFRLEPPRSIEFQIRRAALSRVDDATRRLGRLAIDDHDAVVATVHTVRRRTKQARAIARLARCALGPEFTLVNRSLGDASRSLEPLRTAHVRSVLESAEARAGTEHGGNKKGKRKRKGRNRKGTDTKRGARNDDRLSLSPIDRETTETAVNEALAALHTARQSIERWTIPNGVDTIQAGLRRTYTRGHRNLARSIDQPSDEQFHELRKDVKALWYQIRMIERCAPRALGALVADLDEIGRLLGRDQDLRLILLDSSRGAAPGKVAARTERSELRRRALRLGRIVFAEEPAEFAGRMRSYWTVEDELGPLES